MLQVSVNRFIALGTLSLVFLDLLLITKLNVIRLYPLFPANFYFSYGIIIVYASLAMLMLLVSQRLKILPVVYAGVIAYAMTIGLLYSNNNVIPDTRYWILGFFSLSLFTWPTVMNSIVNIKGRLLNFVLLTEVLLAIFLFVFPSFLGFQGYGMGIPAYLFAFYLARANYYLASFSFVLTFLQGKRGFVLSVIILLLVFIYGKSKGLLIWLLSIGVIFFAYMGGVQFLIVSWGDTSLAELARSAAAGRVNEFLEVSGLIEGVDWITGLGIGFEFERIAYDGEFHGLTGYTHASPFNFYLIGGMVGVGFMLVASWNSFTRSMAVARDYNKYEPLYISVVAFVSCFFSFWSAVSPWFWIFIAFGSTPACIYVLQKNIK